LQIFFRSTDWQGFPIYSKLVKQNLSERSIELQVEKRR